MEEHHKFSLILNLMNKVQERYYRRKMTII
jgi:hypothetical protein